MTECEIFLAALDLPDPAARAAFLDGACAGNTALRGNVDDLLRSHDAAGSFLGAPAVARPDPGETGTRVYTPSTDPDMHATGAADDGPDDALTFLAPPRRPDSLGRIGHYEVLQVLGRGGFGIVFRAFDDILQRVVAVKVLAPHMAATSPARKRFLREARSSAQVRHENVVQVYEVAEQPLPYLVMEFIPGETLQQRLDRTGPLDPGEVVGIGRQVAEGLAAAHATDLIHRDIKPGNILIEGGAHRVKITDFGLARAADDASLSRSGVIAGTPMYMAPEQALGEKLDHRCDLFSLGSVLYQMATGRAPFRASGTVAVLKRVAEDTPRPIREVTPESPQWLCDIISKLHAKSPAARYQSAREVADVLADCEAQLKAHAKVKDFSRIPRTTPAAAPRRRWTRAVLIPAVLLLALAGVWAGPSAARYAANQGVLEIQPGEGLVSVIVLRNDDGVLDGNKLRAPETDWLAMTQPQTLLLPAGRYQLNVGTWPAGKAVEQWEVATSDLFGTSRVNVPVAQTSAIVTVGRGQRVTVRPVIRDAPPRPPPPPLPPPPPPPAPAATPGSPPTFKNGVGMEFVLVPKGKSWLGGGKDKLGDTEVVIPADFYLGKYHVTQEEWEKVMEYNPSYFSRNGGGKDAVKDISDAELKRFPVDTVSWDACQLFVARLNKREKETGWVYRLPKEAEWEYACRGGPLASELDGAFDFYFAEPTNAVGSRANLNRGTTENPVTLGRTCKVGSDEPNVLGLHDMHGNLHVWCDDAAQADDGAAGYAMRGGAWNSPVEYCRAASRLTRPPSSQSQSHGLRLARVPSPAAKAPAAAPAWAVLKPAEMKSDGGATLTLLADDVVLVSGEHPAKDRYTLTFRNPPARIHALRLEVLPHADLPMSGPGRHPDLTFVLSGVKAELEPPGKAGAAAGLRLVRAWADHSAGDDCLPPLVLDADDGTGWCAEFGRPHVLVVELAEPVAVSAGAALRVTLEFQHHDERRSLGCFRLSASGTPQPAP